MEFNAGALRYIAHTVDSVPLLPWKHAWSLMSAIINRQRAT